MLDALVTPAVRLCKAGPEVLKNFVPIDLPPHVTRLSIVATGTTPLVSMFEWGTPGSGPNCPISSGPGNCGVLCCYD